MLSNNMIPITIDSKLSEESTNPLQNKVVTKALNEKAEKDHKHNIDVLTEDPANPEVGYMWITKR